MRNLIALFVLVLSGCVKVPDIPICRDLAEKRLETRDAFGIVDITLIPNPLCLKEIQESRCGYCTYTISAKSLYVGDQKAHLLDGKTWTEIRLSAVLLPVDSYAKMKAYVMDNCKKHEDCQKDIDRWRTKFNQLDSGDANSK